MKKIVCEMCGSNELIKQEGLFVCQSCGTKYSPEEAKKLLIEGTVDVSGSVVKIDQSDEIKNLYAMARRAKEKNDIATAQKYYEQLLLKDLSSWEANFYTDYYQAWNSNIVAGILASRLDDNEKTWLQMIKNNVSDLSEQRKAVEEVATRLREISFLLELRATNLYNQIVASTKADSTHVQMLINDIMPIARMCYNMGDNVIETFDESYGKDIAVPCWKCGISIHNGVMKFFKDKECNKDVIMGYVSKIKTYESDYEPPEIDTSSGACYVATAVYGSYDCPEVWTLRRFRDYGLAKSRLGLNITKIYYATSPTLVKRFGKRKWFINICRAMLDRLIIALKLKGYKSTPYEDNAYNSPKVTIRRKH